MFARRHPYLFFLLCLASIGALTTVVVSLMIAGIVAGSGRYTQIDGGGEKVGIIEVVGVIADAKTVIHQLKQFREDKSIKAIVLRIDSPGGGVGPSQEIYREVRKTVTKKKVVTSMGAVAASGGYYVAAGCNKIMANPGTITGSIGVIISYTNFRALVDKIGLVPVVIKSGPYKDMASPVRELSAAERRILQEFVNQTKQQFVDAIVEGRAMQADKVAKLADGRIYTGQTAHEVGLVDRLGNLEDAIQWAGELAGIKGKITRVYAREKKASWLKYVMDSVMQALEREALEPRLNAGYILEPSVLP